MSPILSLQPCLLLLAGQATPEGPRPLAIEHVRLLTMEGEATLEDQTLVVRDGRIHALGPAAEARVPEGALRIDGTGRTLMPGLADMHVHVWDENDLYLFVANGVTTVRNLFGAPQHLAWRKEIAASERIGPCIYSAGPIIDGKPAVWPDSVELVDPEQAARVVAEQKKAGYDFLKPYSLLTPECYVALAVAAEEQEMRLMGHVPDALELGDVLEAGQAVIEHLGGWAEAAQRTGSPFRSIDFRSESLAWKEVDDARLGECARQMRAAGTWNCPTLVVLQKWAQGDAARAMLARPEMRFVSPLQRAGWAPESPMNYLSRLPAESVRAAHEALPFHGRAVAALRDAGAGILAGTDMGNPYVVAGFALHEELELLVAAGLSPYQALRAATADAARCMRAEGEWGTLVVGASADLLLLEANPLEDVRHTRRTAGVALQGRWFSAEELQAELERRARSFEER